MSQIWFGGIGAGGGAFGAGEAYPDFVHSVRAQFCPKPQAIFPRAILNQPIRSAILSSVSNNSDCMVNFCG